MFSERVAISQTWAHWRQGGTCAGREIAVASKSLESPRPLSNWSPHITGLTDFHTRTQNSLTADTGLRNLAPGCKNPQTLPSCAPTWVRFLILNLLLFPVFRQTVSPVLQYFVSTSQVRTHFQLSSSTNNMIFLYIVMVHTFYSPELHRS